MTELISRCPEWMMEEMWDELVKTISRDSMPKRIDKFARTHFSNTDAQEVFMFNAVLGGELMWRIV